MKKMDVNIEVLESQLTEVEMALLMAINVTMNAAMMAGADPQYMVNNFAQHEDNFLALEKDKAGHVMAALQMLTKNAAGI